MKKERGQKKDITRILIVSYRRLYVSFDRVLAMFTFFFTIMHVLIPLETEIKKNPWRTHTLIWLLRRIMRIVWMDICFCFVFLWHNFMWKIGNKNRTRSHKKYSRMQKYTVLHIQGVKHSFCMSTFSGFVCCFVFLCTPGSNRNANRASVPMS